MSDSELEPTPDRRHGSPEKSSDEPQDSPTETPPVEQRLPPLVATPLRTVAAMATFWLVSGGLFYLAKALTPASSVKPPEAQNIALLALIYASRAIAVVSIAGYPLLKGEEKRILSELRIARAGTDTMRAIALRRRARSSWLTRPFRVGYSEAAICLADGDRVSALQAFGRSTWFLRDGGLLGVLRCIVQADLMRAMGTSAAAERAIRDLLEIDASSHAELERYRVAVLVKSVLERGDSEVAEMLITKITDGPDEELLPYAAWLAAWFEFPELTKLPEGVVRRALLLARNHRASDLIAKLDVRLRPVEPPCE